MNRPIYYPQQPHKPSRGLIVYECSPHSGSTLRRGRCGPQAPGECAHVHLSMCVVRLPTVPLWAKGGPPSAEPAYCSPVRPPQQAHPRRRGHRAACRSSRESEAHAAERAAGPAAAPRRSSRMRTWAGALGHAGLGGFGPAARTVARSAKTPQRRGASRHPSSAAAALPPPPGGCAVAMNCVRVRDELRRHATSAAPFAAIWAGVPNHDPTGRKVERGRCFLDSKVGTGVTQSSDSEARRFNLSALTSSRYHRQAVVDHHFELESRGGNRAGGSTTESNFFLSEVHHRVVRH